MKRIFCDMDGVFSDFVTGYSLVSPHGWQAEEKVGAEAFWKVVLDTPDFWLNLPLMPGARKLWKVIQTSGLPVQMLTAPSTRDAERAMAQKPQWMARHLCPVTVLNFKKAAEKVHFAGTDAILIDDWPSNVEAWRGAGGVAILHTSADATIRELVSLGVLSYHMQHVEGVYDEAGEKMP